MTTIVETGADMVSLTGMLAKNTDGVKKLSAAGRMRRRKSRRDARRTHSSSSYKHSGMFVY